MANPSAAEMLVLANRRRRRYGAWLELAAFAGCSVTEFAALERLSSTATVSRGHRLLTEGTEPQQFYVVQNGYATISRHGAELATIGPGECVGHVALLANSTCAETVTALTEMTLVMLDRRAFTKLLTEVPTLGARLQEA